ncbi:spore germination protein GerW family protein [Streptomyces mutabilis]|uniref:spore germination protein GerW family protein n=1 Tax=Streptomyces mutabilis TaxID=67332 RepID=UPI001ADFF1B1|nr:spore germination protein GerW family protein [Streptomyces mutabilis]
MSEPLSGTEMPLAEREDAVAAATSLLERLAQRLGSSASVSTVFGTPVEANGVTVVPVARVAFGFGGGAGREKDAAKHGEGGGGGGGASATPIGFIEVRDGVATYKPIRDIWTDVFVPMGLVLLGTVGQRAVAGVLRRRRTRRS